MDWGLGNPNKTAALISTLMVLVWMLAYLRSWGFWPALVLFTGLGICLMHTFSRGGIIALCSGLLPLILMAPRPWPRQRTAAVVTAVWVIIGASVYLQAHQRLGQGLLQEDKSITHRVQLWTAAPRMMVDAPGGWGLGNAGTAYMQWYQPLDKNEDYRTLVNSHLTWLVELGWPARIGYLLGWTGIFVVCWPSRGKRWFSVAFGVWVAFAVAAIFSSVAESPWLWSAPVFVLCTVLGARAVRRNWPALSAWSVAPGAVCVCVLLLLVAAASTAREMPIRNEGSNVIIGGAEPAIWLVAEREVFGERYGRTLRESLTSLEPKLRSTVGIASTLRMLPRCEKKLFVTGGRLPSGDVGYLSLVLRESERSILINPTFFPADVPILPDSLARLQVFYGEFAQSPAAGTWHELLQERVRTIEGVGNFAPEWPALLVSRQLKRLHQPHNTDSP